MTPVHLVQCVAGKGTTPAPARDLYTSDWFVKARAYVEAQGGPWFILSAEHGLVDPDETIAPYDVTLNTMRAADRAAWDRRVVEQLARAVDPAAPIVILAGDRYRRAVVEWAGARTTVPMAGLGIGSQKSWLRNAVLGCSKAAQLT
ncbi:DUF6884 domain-containing protein [Sphingomonas oryzagri]|uniref:DUF6884 domain-containing protein n=1 Tax=Sphingomonas oryzagri TaxID=3042314 RepID=A0ABT6N7Q3_9SPHN|nr:DUF6884 domain-containing protein [Sphingomonas oryzagri]MDH7641144.1 hypothetical protein [Sphingomonas oryzagri]